VLQGAAVLNCYHPLTHPQPMAHALRALDPQQRHLLPLLAVDPVAVPRACLEGSYFTQSRLQLDASCPPGTCVNLNALDDTAATRLQWDLDRQRWCLQP